MRAISATLLGAILLLTAPALAQVPRVEHKVTLRAIMQELQTELLQMTNALSVNPRMLLFMGHLSFSCCHS